MNYDVNKAHHRREVYRLALRDYREAVKAGRRKRYMGEGVCCYIRRGLGIEWHFRGMKEIYDYAHGRGDYNYIAPQGELEPRVKMMEEIVASMPEPTLLQRIELFLLRIPNWFIKLGVLGN